MPKTYGVDERSRTEKRILFHKHGVEITIDQLSTGEKQIVFRGAQLLKNMNGITGGIALVDEPELSMHPSWQQKILKYYRGLFTTDGVQNVQMIFATHSEYVLKSALEDRDNVLIIVLRDNDGEIEPKRIVAPSALPTITSAETNFLAFNIASVDYHIELYAYLQNIAAAQTVKECDDYIVEQTAYYNPQKHEKLDSFTRPNGSTISYQSLPTYIRNAIDHPDSGRSYTQEELRCSIELLIQLCSQRYL